MSETTFQFSSRGMAKNVPKLHIVTHVGTALKISQQLTFDIPCRRLLLSLKM